MVVAEQLLIIEIYCAKVANKAPRKIPQNKKQTFLSGLESLNINSDSLFVNVGERTNVTGSKNLHDLIKEKKYDEALEVAREQVEFGAQLLT